MRRRHPHATAAAITLVIAAVSCAVAQTSGPAATTPGSRRTDLTALWQRNGKDVLRGFRNMYAAKVVRVPDREHPLRMWFFGWAANDCNDGESGCDSIYHARGRDLDHWEVYCGDDRWDATMSAGKWKAVVTAGDKPYDQWHNGDPTVVCRDGIFHMAYSSTGFNADGVPAGQPNDKDADVLCVMGAASRDGIHWLKSGEPLLLQRKELGAKHGDGGEFPNGMYHRPSLLWDDGRWKMWFDYWKDDRDGICMGYAECRGRFLESADWKVVRAGNEPLLTAWPNPEVVRIGRKYYSFADPPIPPDTHPWRARKIAEAESDDGLNWRVLGHVEPESNTPACHVPTPFVDESTNPPQLVLFYACQIGGEPYDYRYDRIRYMTRASRGLIDQASGDR